MDLKLKEITDEIQQAIMETMKELVKFETIIFRRAMDREISGQQKIAKNLREQDIVHNLYKLKISRNMLVANVPDFRK